MIQTSTSPMFRYVGLNPYIVVFGLKVRCYSSRFFSFEKSFLIYEDGNSVTGIHKQSSYNTIEWNHTY